VARTQDANAADADHQTGGDGLAAAAGCLSGCALSSLFWLAVAVLVWWWRR
jgi:hypothetical protein